MICVGARVLGVVLVLGVWLAAVPTGIEAAAGETSLRGSELRFERISDDQGLGSNAVKCLLQDSTGYLWIGTEDGIDRYDGVRFRHYQVEGARFPSQRRIFAILEDRDGTLWVGGRGGALDRFDAGTDMFRTVANLPEPLRAADILSLVEDGDGVLWIGTNDGLVRYEPSTNRAEHCGPWPNAQILALALDSTGGLWLGTDHGLVRLDRTSRSAERVNLAPEGLPDAEPPVHSLLAHPAGAVLVGTGETLEAVDVQSHLPGARAFPGLPLRLPHGSVSVSAIVALDESSILAGVQGAGIVRFEAGGTGAEWIRHDTRRPDSIAADSVMALLVDRSGVLWVGDNIAGLSKRSADRQTFRLYRNDPFDDRTLSGNYIRGLHEASDGRLWVCTQYSGVNRIDPTTGDTVRYRRSGGRIPDDAAYSVLEDHAGDVWVGLVGSQGLARLDRRTDRFVSTSLIPRVNVQVLHEDPTGTIWVGTDRGVFEIPADRRSATHHTEYFTQASDSIPVDVNALLVDRRGDLWIGLDGRVLTVVRSTGAVIDRSSSLGIDAPETFVCALHETDDGIWLATKGAGVFVYDPDTDAITAAKSIDGALDSITYGILSDRNGRLWISTDDGIVRYDPVDRTTVRFGTQHGLQGNEFNRRAFCRTRAGTMYFGGTEGLNGFEPESVAVRTTPPAVVISGITVNGVATAFSGQIDLDSHRGTLAVDLAVLDFNAPELNRYAVMLEGADPDWVQLGGTPHVVYANLQPGEYTLRVKGSSSAGVWAEAGTAMRVHVAPPWWRTWWAIGLFGLLAIGAAGGLGVAVRYRLLVMSRLRESAAIARAALLEKESERQRANAAEVRSRERSEAEAVIRAQNERLAELVDDLTRSEQAARDATRAKSEFLANISHEIRTPLNAVLGMADLLLRTSLDETQAEYSRTIRAAGAALMALVDDVLDLSKIEAGALQLNVRAFDLKACVRECVDLVAFNATEKQIDLRWSIDDDVPSTVVSDPDRIRQVVLNLLSNAVKFTDDGSVSLRVWAAPRQSGGDGDEFLELQFEVADSGIGIPGDRLGSLFTMFSQVDSSISRRQGGTGLGLAISRRLVEAMGGHIEVESEVGVGSTFRATIVARRAAEPTWPPTDGLEPTRRGGGPEGRMWILVADDSAVNRYVIGQMLQALGLTAEFVSSGQDAVTAAVAREYDVILMDAHMPELDGIEATRRIRAAASDRHTRIVGLTADVLASTRDRCLAAGMDAVLTKPVDLDQLRHALGGAEAPAVPDPDTGDSILNRTSFGLLELALQRGSGASLAPVITLFVRTCEETIARIDDSMARDAHEEVARHAHSLAGASATIGAERLADACRAVQRAATSRESVPYAEVVGTLGREFQLVRAELEALLPELPAGKVT